MTNVEDFLRTNGIKFTSHTHPAVFTCEEAEIHCAKIPGIAGKNLLLRNNKATRFFLVILPASKRTDLKKLCEIVGENKLSFASPEALLQKLGVTPGSVSPFGLLNDPKKIVEVIIDKNIYEADVVNFHPNRNTASVELSKDMFHEYFQILGREIKIVEL